MLKTSNTHTIYSKKTLSEAFRDNISANHILTSLTFGACNKYYEI